MEFKLTIQVGKTQIELTDSAKNQSEFFQRVSFWTSLPAVGPSGEDDLRIVVRKGVSRKTGKTHLFYSIASPSAGRELAFGVHNDESGNLFPKQWQPIMYGHHNEQGEQNEEEDEQGDRYEQDQSGDNPHRKTRPAPVTNIKDDPKGEATYRQLCAAIKLAKPTAEDIIESCRREDGSVDWNKAKQEARLAIAS